MRRTRLIRSASLRTRVALAAAAAAAAVVAVFTILTSVVLANNDAEQLDRRLDSIVDASMYPDQLSDPRRGVLTTGRMQSTGQVVFQRGLQLPRLQPGTATVAVNGVDYRVRTIPLDQQGGVLVSIGIRADSILLNRAHIPFYAAVGLVTVLIAAGVGWLLAGPAIRPLHRLTDHTRRLGKGAEEMPEVRGVREAEELSEAMTGMLSRLAAAQQATTNSLRAAQDFAANAAHELRTPLTAMRADLDTLRIHDLPPDERAEVVNDLSRAQRRVEAIITALGQLASGELAQAEDREVIDVTDMLDRVVRENVRPSGSVAIEVEADEDLGTIWGWRRAPTGRRQPGAQCRRTRTGHQDRVGRLSGEPHDNDHRGRQRARPAYRRTQGRARPFRARKHCGARRFGTGPGAGRSAGGVAWREHRAFRQSAGRASGYPDGVDFS